MQEIPTTVLAVLHAEIHIPLCRSLKDKRSALRPCLAGLRREFNVAVAEVGDMDRWSAAVLAVATVANDATCVQNRLRQVEDYLHRQHRLEVRDVAVEIL